MALFRRKSEAVRSNLPEPELVAALSLSQTWGDQKAERIQQTYLAYSIYGYGANSVVFSCVQKRIELLAQAEFKFQDRKTRRLFGTADLAVLETPWPNGTTGDLLARMEQHASIAGNSFVRRSGDSLIVMRPDWVDIVSMQMVTGEDREGNPQVHREVVGYFYSEGGIGLSEPVFYPVEDVTHWAPIPDPLSYWRGMSWLTPVLREINADTSMTQHRQTFFDNAGTPNLLLKYQQKLSPSTLESIKSRWQARFGGPAGAGATVVLDEGADFTVVGSTFESMRFTDVQAAGEARIASASGVPAVVAGLQAGLAASTYNNVDAATKYFANTTCAYLWSSACAALAKLIVVPSNARLWYDTTAIAALQDAEKDRADTMQVLASAASTLLTAGYEAQSITAALVSGDLTQLVHTGMISVQLIPNDIASLKADQKTEAALQKAKVAPDDPNKEVVQQIPAGRSASLPEPPQVHVYLPEPAPVERQEPQQVTVNVPPAEVTVNVEPTPVTVQVEPTPVTVEAATVTVPVTVSPADVTILPATPMTRKIKRNSAGEIVSVTEEPT